MSNYYREEGYHSRKRLLRRLRFFALIVLLVALIGIGFFVLDVFNQNKASNTESNSTTPVTSTIVAETDIQTTPYFQFQASSKWKAIANETRDSHYVYRQFNGPLVEQELTIDINNTTPIPLALVQTTRVLPVRASESGNLTPEGSVSDHCLKAAKKGTEKTQQPVTMLQVTFDCNPDSTSYIVDVGIIGGTPNFTLPRPNGTSAKYKITYRNVSALPNARDIVSIIKTFETR